MLRTPASRLSIRLLSTTTTTTAPLAASGASGGASASSAAGAAAAVGSAVGGPASYITFAQYRQQATHYGQLAAVRQAYPRTLNTESEMKKIRAHAEYKLN